MTYSKMTPKSKVDVGEKNSALCSWIEIGGVVLIN